MKTSLWLKIVPVLIMCLVLGCATYVAVDVLKPAEVNVGPARKIAVLDFEFEGHWDLDKEKEPGTLREIAEEAIKKSLGRTEKAEPPPDPLTAFPGKKVSEYLMEKLVENGHFTVLERERISRIMEEHELAMTGIVGDEKAAQIGELLGVEAIIFGSGEYHVVDDGNWYEHESEDDGKRNEYKLVRKVDAQLTYRIVDVSSGSIIGSKTNSSRNYDESKSSLQRVFNPYDDHVEADEEATAREKIVDWYPIVDRLVKEMVKKSVSQIAPHYVQEKRAIKTGKSQLMKTGLEYAKRDLWEDARSSWESVVERQFGTALEDHVAAKYNLGIYYEINGDLDKAEEFFRQCFQESGNSEYLDARARVESRKRELERLREQQDSKITQ